VPVVCASASAPKAATIVNAAITCFIIISLVIKIGPSATTRPRRIQRRPEFLHPRFLLVAE
jgi:hypothetical protein